MVTKERQNALSKANGYARNLYIDRVNEKGKKLFTSEEENARTRKAFSAFLKHEIAKNPELATDPAIREFLEYHDAYETIKAGVKEDLGI